jgi:hypothetical protein
MPSQCVCMEKSFFFISSLLTANVQPAGNEFFHKFSSPYGLGEKLLFIQSSYFLWLMCYTVVPWLASRIKWGQHLGSERGKDCYVLNMRSLCCFIMNKKWNFLWMRENKKKLWPSVKPKYHKLWWKMSRRLLVSRISTYNGHFMPSFSRYEHIVIGF